MGKENVSDEDRVLVAIHEINKLGRTATPEDIQRVTDLPEDEIEEHLAELERKGFAGIASRNN
jgi:hypothetical protein